MKTLEKYNEANEQLIYKNPFTGKDTIVEIWANPIGQFTIRSGANSDFSYTGFCPNVTTMQQSRDAVTLKYLSKELFK